VRRLGGGHRTPPKGDLAGRKISPVCCQHRGVVRQKAPHKRMGSEREVKKGGEKILSEMRSVLPTQKGWPCRRSVLLPVSLRGGKGRVFRVGGIPGKGDSGKG